LVLPLRFWGIANEDEQRALGIAADCILQWHRLSPAARAQAHPESQRFMDPAGNFFEELVAALRDKRFEEEGEVADFRNKARFGISLEISVEGLHATNQRYVNWARHHSECYISVNSSRKGAIAKVVDSAAGMSKMTQLVAQCSSAPSCLHALGLQHHPRARPCIQPNGLLEARFPHSTATRIIYQNDELTQCQDLFFLIDPAGHDGGGGGGGAEVEVEALLMALVVTATTMARRAAKRMTTMEKAAMMMTAAVATEAEATRASSIASHS